MKLRFLILTLTVLFASCGEERRFQPKLPVGDKIEDIPSYVMQGFKLNSVENGEVVFKMEAKAAQVFEMKKKAYAQFVTVTYYEKVGKPTILTGDRAIINTDTNFIEVTGNIKMKSAEGMQLFTEKLFWDDHREIVYGDGRVTVYKGKNVLSGTGFESDAHLKNIKILKGVEVKAKDITNE